MRKALKQGQLIASTQSDDADRIDTTCPYCGVGCGISVSPKTNLSAASTLLKGRTDHPANGGRLCVKGSSLHETLDLNDRLLTPKIDGKESTWDAALDNVANSFRDIIDKHGPDAVAFYLSGQLLTEDYYVANKLMKGFLGSANIDTNSRLCMASAVVAHKRAFGADVVPGCYDDLEQAQALFFIGSNAAYAHPIVFQRIAKAKKDTGMKVVVLDPRRTATCDIADLHVPLKPGSDAFFYNGLLSYLADNDGLDSAYIATHCENFDATLTAAKEQVPDIDTAARLCDVPKALIEEAYECFIANRDVVSMFSQGINQSSSGVDKGNAIINVHLASGKIGRPGATPFSITGQPNAMGGREVGGLANQLAAHMSFNEQDLDTVRRFWGAPHLAKREGLKAVDMFDAVERGEVKAIWIMGTNPVVSMPNADKIKSALEKCELVVVSECMANTDTAAYANVLLPATTWGEKQGTVTNSERTISVQRRFLPAPGEARNDWQIISDFAAKLGHQAKFDYEHVADVFKEHAALSGFENERSARRAFDISGLKDLSKEDYLQLQPFQWPLAEANATGTQRLFEDGRFFMPNGKAQFVPIVARLPAIRPQAKQFVMNTGRIRDQWHTMTRTGKAARLLTHISEPFVQMHPQDAQDQGLVEGQLVECHNLGSRYLGRVKVTRDQRHGEVFVPMHWNSVYASSSRAGALVGDVVDPLCGQPEFKHSPVIVEAYPAKQHGFLISRTALDRMPTDYWSKTTLENGLAFRFADTLSVIDWKGWLEESFEYVNDWVTLKHGEKGQRWLGFKNGCLELALFVEDRTCMDDPITLPDPLWLATQLGQKTKLEERYSLLAGAPGDPSQSPGKIICSCFQVGENQIRNAVKQGVESVDELGKRLKCGTNCGSCLPELSTLLNQTNKNKETA